MKIFSEYFDKKVQNLEEKHLNLLSIEYGGVDLLDLSPVVSIEYNKTQAH